MLTHAEREKNARAGEAVGWQLIGEGLRGVWRSPSGSLGGLPRFGSDPAAARALLEAVPQPKRAAVVQRLISEPHKEVNLLGLARGDNWIVDANEVFDLLLLAPPAAIRDAVLEVMDT